MHFQAKTPTPDPEISVIEPDEPDPGTSLEAKIARQQYDQDGELHTLRKDYAAKLFQLIKFWISGVALLIVLVGFAGHTAEPIFKLSDAVIITIITSTTATIIGLFVIAARWLFADGKIPKKTASK